MSVVVHPIMCTFRELPDQRVAPHKKIGKYSIVQNTFTSEIPFRAIGKNRKGKVNPIFRMLMKASRGNI